MSRFIHRVHWTFVPSIAAVVLLLVLVGIRDAGSRPTPSALGNAQFSSDNSHNSSQELSIAEVYRRVAPATVLVRYDLPDVFGHGTGIVVDGDGWILTNHHVVEIALPDPENGAQVLSINIGRYVDGQMVVDDVELTAHVYATSPDQDLALLRVADYPHDRSPLPSVSLAETVPPTGSSCVVVGHPRAGALWTIRSGEIANVVNWPNDTTSNIVELLTMSAPERGRATTGLDTDVPFMAVYSSCPLNPGDSGGPLVNMQGELIAVSFAGHADTSVDRFGYHIHIDEVREFLSSRSDSPQLYVPSAWPDTYLRRVIDVDGDGLPDTLVYFDFDENDEPRVMAVLVDLDQDSLREYSADEIAGCGPHGGWDFEFAWHRGPTERTFWDLDNDSMLDLILISNGQGDGDFAAHARERIDDAWQLASPAGRTLMQPVPELPRHARQRLSGVRRLIELP